MSVVPKTLVEAMEMAWVYFRKQRPPAQNIVAVPEGYGSHGKVAVAVAAVGPTGMQLNSISCVYTPFAWSTPSLTTGGTQIPSPRSHVGSSSVATVAPGTGLFQAMGTQCGTTVPTNTVCFRKHESRSELLSTQQKRFHQGVARVTSVG